MRYRIPLKKILQNNWKAKLICLVCAMLVWLMVKHLLEHDDSPEWDIDDIRISLPE